MMQETVDRPDTHCLALQSRLDELDASNLPKLLSGARLDLLSFVAAGAGMVRRVLVIERASRELLDGFPLRDPTAIDDAQVVRASSLRAVDQLGQVLAFISGWLEESPTDPDGIANEIRSLLHTFNNVLVGITCYAELLAAELQDGDPCHAALLTITQEGMAISRLVRERTRLQPYITELLKASPVQARALEPRAMALLLSTFGIQATVDGEGCVFTDPTELAHAIDVLPPIEGHVVLEVLRRLDGIPN
jgi:hypothetical protein